MTIMNAVNGLVSDALDRLADLIATRPPVAIQVATHADEHLAHPDRGRAVIAKMARSEVKSYLADLAEQAGVPFTGPIMFIHDIQHVICPACREAADDPNQ